jgi:Major tropism determinant N-terminal domain
MATRMQQRRGTAAQWISTNSGSGPILNAGEIGYETDTNKFKIGDGTNHWVDLDYFVDSNSTANPSFGTDIKFEGATVNAYKTTFAVTDPTANRTITLPNASGTVALTSDIAELSQDAIDAALTAGTGITKTYDDAANTLTLAVNTGTIQARVANVSDQEIGYLDGVTSAIQTQIDSKAPLASPAFTGTATGVNLTLSGNLTVNGTTTTVNSTEVNIKNAFTFEGTTDDNYETTLTVTDPTADRSIVLPDATGTVALQEFVQAAATSTDGLGWNNTTKKITLDTAYVGEVAMDAVAGAISPGSGISKVYDDAANTITLDISSTVATKTYADGAVGTHNSSTTSVHGISNTANLVATTDTGTVTSTMIANGTIVDADINASAAIATSKISGLDTALAAKAPLASPTFTGTVTLPSGTVTSTMILDGTIATADIADSAITSAKIADGTIVTGDIADGAITTAKILDGTIATADIADSAITSAKIANDTIVDADINSAAAIAQSKISGLSTSLGLKADLASPTFTGTVTIPSGASISGFAPLASPALTGTPTAPTAAAATNTTQVATTAFVRGEVNALVNGASAALDTLGELAAALTADEATAATLATLVGTKAPIASPTFTGTVTIPAGASISGFAPLASPTFTGTNTVAALTVSGSGLITASSAGLAFTDGTQTKEGVPSRTPIIQKTASYTLTATTERDSLIEVASASGTTITIPTNSAVAYPVGTSIDILQTSTGQVTIAGDTGVTVNATPGLKLRTQWSSATLFKRATNTWVVFGDLTA